MVEKAPDEPPLLAQIERPELAAPPHVEAPTPTLTLASDRAQGTRIVKTESDEGAAAPRRTPAVLSNKPPQFLHAEEPADAFADAPVPGPAAVKPAAIRRIQYPDRHSELASAEAPVPGDASPLDTAVAQGDDVEDSTFIVPAEPSNFGR